MQNLVQRRFAIGDRKRDGEQQRPKGRHLAEMVMPEMRGEQGKQGDGQQDAEERQAAPHRQELAQMDAPMSRSFRRVGNGDQRQQQHSERNMLLHSLDLYL
ncbi:MAG: hypothetical protein BWY83_01744 [bacterium ADurb.Bin478]|nr:MAG: hypothetical protein BWY83_01744 [bacterium ADurb.Bin478]